MVWHPPTPLPPCRARFTPPATLTTVATNALLKVAIDQARSLVTVAWTALQGKLSSLYSAAGRERAAVQERLRRCIDRTFRACAAVHRQHLAKLLRGEAGRPPASCSGVPTCSPPPPPSSQRTKRAAKRSRTVRRTSPPPEALPGPHGSSPSPSLPPRVPILPPHKLPSSPPHQDPPFNGYSFSRPHRPRFLHFTPSPFSPLPSPHPRFFHP